MSRRLRRCACQLRCPRWNSTACHVSNGYAWQQRIAAGGAHLSVPLRCAGAAAGGSAGGEAEAFRAGDAALLALRVSAWDTRHAVPLHARPHAPGSGDGGAGSGCGASAARALRHDANRSNALSVMPRQHTRAATSTAPSVTHAAARRRRLLRRWLRGVRCCCCCVGLWAVRLLQRMQPEEVAAPKGLVVHHLRND
jgi:hypothetical protein